MNFEIIKENLPVSKPVIECAFCKTTDSKEWTYAMLKNIYYCPKCTKDLPNINSVLDERLESLEKKYEDVLKSLVVKNKQIKTLEVEYGELKELTVNINKFLETIIKEEEKINIE